MSETTNMLARLFDNPLVKTLALDKIKKAFKNHGVTLITVSADSNGELKFDVYEEPMKVMTQTDFTNTIKTLSE